MVVQTAVLNDKGKFFYWGLEGGFLRLVSFERFSKWPHNHGTEPCEPLNVHIKK